jgi:autotransporter-associated beta strand protein
MKPNAPPSELAATRTPSKETPACLPNANTTALAPRCIGKFVIGFVSVGLMLAGASAKAATDTWTGLLNNNWDMLANWSGVLKPGALDDAVFPQTIPFTGMTVTLGVGETANSLTFLNGYTFTSGDLTLTGGNVDVGSGLSVTINSVLRGQTVGLTLTDTGRLVLGGANQFGGAVQITGGTLSISSDANLGTTGNAIKIGNATRNATLQTTASFTLGSGRAVTLNVGGGTFDVANNTTLTVAGPIGGTGALIKDGGAGTIVLTAANTYSGGTVINLGQLIVTGSISGATTINNGGLLGGSGSVGAVSAIGPGSPAATTATIDPGNVPGGGVGGGTGTLSSGDFTVTNGAHLALQIGATTTGGSPTLADKVSVAGAINLTNADLQLSFFNSPVFNGQQFTIIANDGLGDAVTGFFASLNGVPTDLSQGAVFSIGSQQFAISYRAAGTTFDAGPGQGNDVMLQAIPEPSTGTAILLGMSALIGIQRFRSALRRRVRCAGPTTRAR